MSLRLQVAIGWRGLRSLLAALRLTLALVFLGAASAQAADLADALQKFTTDQLSDTESGIAAVVASGSDRAQVVLQALADRKLYTETATKLVFIQDADGKISNAVTGETVASLPAGAGPVRLNNRLRGLIDSSLGSLTLASTNPATRLAAADALFKSRDAKALAAVEAQFAKESDAGVKAALGAARASILLSMPGADAAAQIDAVALLTERPTQDSISMLKGVLESQAPEQVKERARIGIQEIDRRLSMLAVAQTVVYGLSLGSVLLLAAIGLAITFGVMGVINMAHGEMVMLGAYTTFMVQEGFRAWAPKSFDWSLPVAIPLAFLVAGAVGLAIERGIIRFLYGRPLETLLATWGVSLILQQAVRTWFGANNREVGAPSYMSGSVELFGLHVTAGRLWIIVLTLAVFFALLAILNKTALGLKMRAVTQNRRMAGSMGIATERIDALAFALGSGIAGIAGVALSQIDNVSPNLGQSYIIDSFMVVVFGGVGSLWGTLVSAFALGIANKALEPIVGAVLGKILILVLLILFIQKRPRGLFALKGRAIEA